VKQDPLALAIFGAALALLAALLLYVFFVKAPEPAPSTPSRSFELVEKVRREIDAVTSKIGVTPSKPAPAAQVSAAPSLEAGRSWRYQVVVEPPAWKNITLTYRTQNENESLVVRTDFVHSGGKSNFYLGVFAPGHVTHANTRFPGFFMYASYLPANVKEGQRLTWSWPWQPVTPGRVKRFEGEVKRFESVQVPAGTYNAAVIAVDLYYEDNGSVRARVKETLWYVPKLRQVVKVLREGRAPDEGSQRITAELVELR
jgi:hypothetical protein